MMNLSQFRKICLVGVVALVVGCGAGQGSQGDFLKGIGDVVEKIVSRENGNQTNRNKQKDFSGCIYLPTGKIVPRGDCLYGNPDYKKIFKEEEERRKRSVGERRKEEGSGLLGKRKKERS